MENRLKRKLADDTLTFCLGVNQARTPNIAMIAAASGFDAIYVDLEHNPTSLETCSMLCVAAIGAGITPMVRIGSQDGHLVARVLDGGAQGLMVPHINSVHEARAIVTACRFPPVGHRSAGGAGPALGYRQMPQGEINDFLNRETLLLAMLETPEAIEQAEAIAAVPGIDGLHIGSNDLCSEMGIPGAYRDPRYLGAVERAGKAAHDQGKCLGIGGILFDHELQTEIVRLGARYLTAGNDVQYLVRGARADVERMKTIPVPRR
ncbi:MAG: aldolase/citrate lyase family protein [Acetobacteraceae bacterium]